MRRTLALCALTLMTIPLAFAHTPEGTPKTYCEPPSEWRTHDYDVAPADAGVFANAATPSGAVFRQSFGPVFAHVKVVGPYLDGNRDPCGPALLSQPDCAALSQAGLTGPAYDAVCGGRIAEFDAHREFGHAGRALLVTYSGDGVTNGGIACYAEQGHHPAGGLVTVTDVTHADVSFEVISDYSHPLLVPDPTLAPDCGDGIVQPCDAPQPTTPPAVQGALDTVRSLLITLLGPDAGNVECTVGDRSLRCLNSCLLSFAPGADGAYHVRVGPTDDGNNGSPTGADKGHVEL